MWLVELPAYTEDIPDEPSVVESNRMVSLRSCRRLGWYLGWLHEVGQKPISWLDFFGDLAEASFSLRKSNHFGGASEGSQSGTTHHFACAMGSKWATWHFIGYKAFEYGWQPPSITQSFFGSPRLLRIAYYIRFAHSLGPHFQPIWKLKVHCLVAQQLREFMSMSLRSSKLSGPIPSFAERGLCFTEALYGEQRLRHRGIPGYRPWILMCLWIWWDHGGIKLAPKMLRQNS